MSYRTVAASTPTVRFVALLLCYTLLASPAITTTSKTGSNVIPPRRATRRAQTTVPQRTGELLIRFTKGIQEADRQRILESRGAQARRPLRGSSNAELISFPADRDLDSLATELRLLPEVDAAEPNYLISADQGERTPNDPRFSEQWALKNAEANTSDIQAPAAWEQTTGSPSTVIAVIDSGIDFSHTDLQNNRWTNPQEQSNGTDDDRNGLADDLFGWDYVKDTGELTDEQGHGTAVAGIIAAEGDNQTGTVGVMWRASLMDLRVLDKDGQGDIARAVEAIDYATAHGAQVINLSWSTAGESTFLRDAILRAGRRGALVVCSAGNSGEDLNISPRYPASFDLPNVLSVAATDTTDHLIPTSSRSAQHVHVGAPGINILTTSKGGGYATLTGTSAAAAIVSGVAGLLRTQRPHLRAGHTRDAIKNGVRQSGELAGKVVTSGVVSAANSLGILQSLPPSSDLQPGREDEEIPAEKPAKDKNPDSRPIEGSISLREERRGNPQPGAPGAGLPNLDEVRRTRSHEPKAPEPEPSTKRGLRHEKKDKERERERGNPNPEPTPTATPSATPTASPTATPTPIADNSPATFMGGTNPSAFSTEGALLALAGDPFIGFTNDLFGTLDRTLSDSPFTIFGRAPSSAFARYSMSMMVPLTAPTNLTAVAAPGGTQVNLSWMPVSGASSYRIERRQGVSDPYTSIATTSGTNYTDTTAPSAPSGRAYLYRVIAVDSAGATSPTSNTRLAVAMTFMDDPLQAPPPVGSGTRISAEHITQLRQAINAIRRTANLSAVAWIEQPNDLRGTVVSANHITEMRAKLNEALTVLGMPLPTYFEPGLTGGYTYTIKRQHISDLRAAVNASGAGGEGGGSSPNETVWVEDAPPAGGVVCTIAEDNTCEPNAWAVTTPAPVSGTLAQQLTYNSALHLNGIHQYYFSKASQTLPLGVGDKFFAYVYLDPTNPPREIMLQLNAGVEPDAWFRAYWSSAADRSLNLIPWGTDGTRSRRYMGALPAAGQWVRLEVPASLLELEGQTLHGLAFTMYGGKATWDRAGKVGATSADGGGTGLTGSYYGTGWSQPFVDLRTTRTDSSVNFNWGISAPATNVPADDFTVRWEGQVSPRFSESYTFYTLSDDGVRLWVNNQLLVDNWTHHGATENSNTITLEAGQKYNIRMEYYEATGGAVAKLSWSSASQPKQVIPQSRLYPLTSAPPPTTEAEVSTARTQPENRTGGSDLYSGNYSWSVPLVGLPGRAGMDLGLSLAYNSLVWTKTSGAIAFDADRGYPAPGFRLGFPVVQPKFLNPQTGKSAYLLITPSGSRVELRQVGTSNTYESADSSYLQLNDYGSNLLLRTTDGTQLNFAQAGGGEYVCVQIKDRNGNFITPSYNADGDLKDVTDTLGRKLVFVYDAYGNLQEITQQRGSVTYKWATFGFGDAQTVNGVSSPTVGIQSGASVPLLRWVGLADGTKYTFGYNSYGQVQKIARETKNAADAYVERMYTSYTLVSTGGDCPKVTERKAWAENWSGVNGVPAEVTTTYTGYGTGITTVGLPDGTSYKETFGTTGWKRGLPLQTETLGTDGTPNATASVQKTTATEWEHDGAADAQYATNPRVTKATVSDSASTRITAVTHTPYDLPNGGGRVTLPTDVRECKGDCQVTTNVLRHTKTVYNLDQVYTDKRIIGLTKEVSLYEGESTLLSHVEYKYDEGSEYLKRQGIIFGHDGTYNEHFIQGRGLATSVWRRDITALTDDSKASIVRTGYNTQGSVIFTRQKRRVGEVEQEVETKVSYADSFSDGVNRNLLAYPTQVTDPANFSSKVQYSFDTGAVTRSEDPKGAVATTTYDAIGRPERITNTVNGAYTRYVYAGSGSYVQQYTTVESGKPEAYSISVFDGAGRVRSSAADNSTEDGGGYRGQMMKYDVMGRAVESSNPAHMDGNWNAIGDDAAGWLYTKQTYDWRGRPRVTTNTDLTTKSASYGGCGCAGGETVTLTNEVGRMQRMTSDVLGRTVKVEDFNTGGSVYRTVTNTYNARNQVTQTNAAGRISTVEYDGHGRAWKSKSAMQDAPTTIVYNPDDSVQQAADARGASATYTYNSRGLVTNISYQTPNATLIPVTGAVALDYDAAGNRQWMTDGAGRTDYSYNTQSQLTTETRQLNGLSGSFALNYTYNLAGGLKSVTDPFNSRVDYGYDHTGRLRGVTGTPFGGVTSYVAGMQYRAWGGAKGITYGNQIQTNINYTARSQPSSFEVTGRNTQYGASPTIMLSQYSYYADGQLRFADDGVDNRFDRAFSYDHVGRLKLAYTGGEARNFVNNIPGGTADGPYYQDYSHDVWDQMTSRVTRFWSQSNTYTATFANATNTRRQGWVYDAAGNILQDDTLTYKYDAAGRNVEVQARDTSASMQKIINLYDGDGRAVKRTEVEAGGSATPPSSYNIYSAVLGRIITELTSQGQKFQGYVYAGGEMVAKQHAYGNEYLEWQHTNPLTGSRATTDVYRFGGVGMESDPVGIDTGTSDPFITLVDPSTFEPDTPSLLPMEGGGWGGDCTLDGMQFDCAELERRAETGGVAAEQTFHDGQRFRTETLPVVSFGGGVIYVDRWEDYTIPGRGGSAGGEIEGGTTGSRNVGFFVNIQGTGGGQRINRTPPIIRPYTGPLPLLTPQAGRPLTADEIATIRGEVAAMVNRDKCKTFINNLIVEAAKETGGEYSADILFNFDQVSSQGGFHARYYQIGTTPSGEPVYAGGNTNGGDVLRRDVRIDINPTSIAGLSRGNNALFVGSTALHEVIHASGTGFTDSILARAVARMRGETEPPFARNMQDVSARSRDWNVALQDACLVWRSAFK